MFRDRDAQRSRCVEIEILRSRNVQTSRHTKIKIIIKLPRELDFLKYFFVFVPSRPLSVYCAISVYQLLASNNLPTSDVMPLLTKFLLVQTIMVYLSLLVSLFLAQMKGRIETRQNLANRIIYFVLVEIIGYVFLLRLDYRYKHVCRIKEKFNKIDVAVSNIDEDHRNTNENGNGNGSSHQHQNWAREEKEHLIDLEWQLIFTSLDRLAAVSYILFLCLWVGWLFWSVDDQEQIDEIVRGLDL